MSAFCQVVIDCDTPTCRERFTGRGTRTRIVQVHAGMKGWRVGSGRHYCPACVARLGLAKGALPDGGKP